MIYCRPKWSLGLPCTWNKCKCYWFDLLFSIGSAHTCLLHLLNESGHFLSRLGSHRERLLLRFLRGRRMAWETSMQIFYPMLVRISFRQCWLQVVPVLWLFVGCTGHRFAFPVSSVSVYLCVHAPRKAFTCLVIIANRWSAWAAKHVKHCRKMGWSGLRGLSLFPFLNFVQDQLDLKHSCLLWV